MISHAINLLLFIIGRPHLLSIKTSTHLIRNILFYFLLELARFILPRAEILKEIHCSLSVPQVHFWAVAVCFPLLLPACICTTQTGTGGLPGDFTALSLWRLQIHCSKICIPQRFYNPFRMIEDLHISVGKLTQTLLKSFVLTSTVHNVKVSWHIMTLHQYSILLQNLTETQTSCLFTTRLTPIF